MLAYLPRSLLLWLCVKLLSCSLNILLAKRFKHKERVRLMKLTIKLLVPCETMLFWSCKNDKWEFCTIEVSSIPTKATMKSHIIGHWKPTQDEGITKCHLSWEHT